MANTQTSDANLKNVLDDIEKHTKGLAKTLEKQFNISNQNLFGGAIFGKSPEDRQTDQDAGR